MNKKHARDLVNGGLVTALLIATLASPLAQATAIPAFTSPAIHAGITPSLDQASQWVNADQARTTYGVTGAGLTAAIIDTGINYNHTALGGGFGAGFKVVAGYDFANDDNNPFDTINHGSHVAGIVASTDSTYQGIAPDANLAALKVFTDAGEGIFEYLENALQWTLDNHSTYNISVVNMSLGDEGNYTSNPYTDTAVTEKIEQLYNQNIAVVVAAGNGYADAEGMSYPAIVPQTVSVGSVYRQTPPPVPVSSSQRLSSATGGNFATDIFAPGAAVTSTVNDNLFSVKGGTSMAAPLISGSLLLAQELYLDRFSVLPSVDDLMQWMTLGGTAFVDTGNTFTAIDVLGFLNEIPLNTVPLPGTQWLLAAFIPPILRPRRRLAQGRLIGIALTEVLHLQRPALPILSPGHHPGTVATVRHKHPRPSDPVSPTSPSYPRQATFQPNRRRITMHALHPTPESEKRVLHSGPVAEWRSARTPMGV